MNTLREMQQLHARVVTTDDLACTLESAIGHVATQISNKFDTQIDIKINAQLGMGCRRRDILPSPTQNLVFRLMSQPRVWEMQTIHRPGILGHWQRTECQRSGRDGCDPKHQLDR